MRKWLFFAIAAIIVVSISGCTDQIDSKGPGIKEPVPKELLQACPVRGISNRMPCSAPNCDYETYYDINGTFVPSSELDMEWIEKNCGEIPISILH